MKDKILFIDTETGGLNPDVNSLLSIALVIWQDMEVVDSIEININDGILNVTDQALSINNINIEEHKKKAISPNEAVLKIIQFIELHFDLSSSSKITLAGHNINFDVNFFKKLLSRNDVSFSSYFSHRFIDTSSILYYLYISGVIKNKAISSNYAFELFNIKVKDRHTALGDAIATAQLFSKLVLLLKK